VRGVPLLEWLDADGPPAAGQVDRWATELGEVVAALAAVPRELVDGVVPRDETSPADLVAEVRRLADLLLEELPPAARPGVVRFAAGPPPPAAERLVLCHGDLGAEHVFVDPGTLRITGIIDWSDAAVTDPALDLGLVLRDLGPRALRLATTALGSADPGLTARAGFHARTRALEDLAYGLEHGRGAYRRNALRAVAALFGADPVA
jgi:aminoglycoside phosphotransferase (APT) family kinase protein